MFSDFGSRVGNCALNGRRVFSARIDYSQYMHCNATEYLDSAYGTVVEGNYAYIAHTTLGLKVADITDPDDPQEIGALGGMPLG